AFPIKICDLTIDDCIEPGTELGSLLEGLERPHYGDEDVLYYIFHIIDRHTTFHPVINLRQVAIVKREKRFTIALLRPTSKLSVIVCVHSTPLSRPQKAK